MRGILLSVVLAGAFAIAAPTIQPASAMTAVPTISATTSVYALQVPDSKIEISVNDRGGARWYRSPIWIAIGALAAVVILLLVILAVRGGGGTTIVKD